MKTIIHVNQNKIRSREEKPMTVKTYKSNSYCNEVEINGPSKVIYSPEKPLSYGARCWVETESQVIIKA
jgi:hypothetical protein